MNEERLAALMESAQVTYRNNPTDANKAEYRRAVQALADYRQAARGDRPFGIIAENNTDDTAEV